MTQEREAERRGAVICRNFLHGAASTAELSLRLDADAPEFPPTGDRTVAPRIDRRGCPTSFDPCMTLAISLRTLSRLTNVSGNIYRRLAHPITIDPIEQARTAALRSQ